MAKKKLCYVLNALGTGGTEIIVKELALFFSDRYQIEIIALDSLGTIAEEIAADPAVRIHFLQRKPGLKLSNFRNFCRLIKQVKPDLIHAHQHSPWFYSAVAKKLGLTTAPLIFTEHGRFYPDIVSTKRRVANQLLAGTTNCVTGVSQFSLDAVRKQEGLGSIERQLVIYNGIRPEKNQVSLRDKLGLSDSDKILLFVGSLRHIKNPLLLIRAFAGLLQQAPNLKLVMIGDGELMDAAQQLLQQHNLDGKLFLTGELRPAKSYVADCDLFIQPSRTEAHSLALTEAMAHRLPCIVSSGGGSPEVIKHQQNGLILSGLSEQAIGQAVLFCLEHPEKANSLGEAAYYNFEQYFRLEVMLENYQNIYQDLFYV